MTWDSYFMSIAEAVSRKSKDPSTQCGAVLANAENRIVSVGYNGFPRGVVDDLERLRDRETKLLMTLHAEINAVLFAQCSLEGATCYVWPMPPCARCAAVLIQAGVKRVVAQEPDPEQYNRWSKELSAAQWLWDQAGVVVDLHTRRHL
jgi:dCMP deaminase